MASLVKSYHIKASGKAVFDALTNPVKIEKWSGHKAKMSVEPGSKFSLWGGSIHGVNHIVTNGLIEQDWQEKEWKRPSKVRFNWTEEKGKTKLVLHHDDIPEKHFNDINAGWDDYYLGPIKEMLEDGSLI